MVQNELAYNVVQVLLYQEIYDDKRDKENPFKIKRLDVFFEIIEKQTSSSNEQIDPASPSLLFELIDPV
jgi:hypothetical protein